MTPDFVISYGRESLWVAAQVAGPILLIALAVGLIISLFQAITQIQEATLAFIPKVLAIVMLLFFMYPWLLETAAAFMRNSLINFPTYINF